MDVVEEPLNSARILLDTGKILFLLVNYNSWERSSCL